MRLKKNPHPELPVCEMACDVELHKKLNKFDLTKFMNCHSTNLFCGLPGSGKTNLLYQFMKSKHLLNKCFNKIYLFQPAESRASMKDKLFDQLPENQKFGELTLENLSYVNGELNEEENSCILFDDMGAHLKDKEVRKLLKEIIMNRRHKYVSIFFLTQTYFSVDKEIRRLFSNIFVFKVNHESMMNIFEEVVESHKDKVREIVSLVYDKPFQYLFINVSTQRMFKGFDEIVF